MKWKLILTISTFFVATPILIGQSLPDIPTVPATPAIPGGIPSTVIPTALPTTSIPAVLTISNPLPASLLGQSGLDTSVLGVDPSTRAQELRDQYKQGLLDDHRLPTVPNNTTQAGDLAKRFAEQTFPQEFQASKGRLALPESAPSAFPTTSPSVPTTIPTVVPTPPTNPSL